MQAIRRLVDTVAGVAALSAGNEAIALGSLALGAHGLISGLATAIPEPFVALTAAFARGDMETALREQRRINCLLPMLPAGARIGAIKRILQQRNIPAGGCVPPRPTPELPGIWERLRVLL
jgi:dihydrodipicolinate synthase/N-acetylneuraminate lyase